MNLLLPTISLIQRELQHCLRDRARLVAVVVQPLLFWVLIGSGLNASFSPAGHDANYMAYFFPGIILMVILFTSIFSTYSIIDDRQEGFLQVVLIAPMPRSAVVLGKVIGGSIIGTLQALLFLLILLTPWINVSISPMGFLWLLAWMLIVGCLLTGTGFLFAWVMTSRQAYHGIMTAVFFPLWIFSGAAFPLEGAPGWLHTAMLVNPMTHGLSLLRHPFAGAGTPEIAIPIAAAYVLISTAIVFIGGILIARRRQG